MKVFISHSSNDKKFTRLLKHCLKENDIDTWFDEDELNLGDSLLRKLEKALSDSSHFVIILSKASVNSDWVQLELKRAIKHQRSGLMSKIIPIKYRECDIPEELLELLYADLTNEVVLPDGEKVKFISDGFDPFFLRLVKALKSPLNSLNENEKEEIKKSLAKGLKTKSEASSLNITRGIYLLDGLTEYDAVNYRDKISKVISKDKSEIRPILLPESLKSKWKLNLGDEIEIIGPDFKSKSVAHFVDFRIDDIKIVAHVEIRKYANIQVDNYYSTEFNIEENKISFIQKIIKESNIDM